MPGQHAKLSPSASARWISCPASIRMEAALPPGTDEDSVYAREGTIAHALGEIEASLYFGLVNKVQYNKALRAWRKEFDAQGYPEDTLVEMQGHVRAYVQLIKERLARRPHSRVLLEQRMDSGVPTCWGTSDVVIVSPTHVEIIDLKYGAGVPVYAQDNSQLRLYGCGAMDTFGDLLGVTDTIYMTIFQPRAMDQPSTEELPVEALRDWRALVALPAAEQALGDDAPFGPSEKACRWCPVAGICRARVEKAVVEDFGSPFVDEPLVPPAPEMLSPAELGQVLHRIPEIKAWCAAVEAHALEVAYGQGQHIPGWKVVMSGGRRGITDHTAAVQTLIDAGYQAEQVADFKAKGIGVLEKLVGKKELPVLLGDLLAKGSGKESLVPESDSRQAISPTGQAAAEFDVVQGELVA